MRTGTSVLIAIGLMLAVGTGKALAASGENTVPEFINSELTAGLNLPFSEVARVGNLLYLSGMIAIRPGTTELIKGGIEEETRQTLENIEMMLKAAGATRRDVVKCTVMLDDIGKWGRGFNQTYVEFFGDHRPARSALGADGLALGAAVEISCIAVLPEGRH
jgi:2-iminobutanoate/2-iminopropanoate deaminase